jgi:hypothetical protein
LTPTKQFLDRLADLFFDHGATTPEKLGKLLNFPIPEWYEGTASPTLAQIERLAELLQQGPDFWFSRPARRQLTVHMLTSLDDPEREFVEGVPMILEFQGIKAWVKMQAMSAVDLEKVEKERRRCLALTKEPRKPRLPKIPRAKVASV